MARMVGVTPRPVPSDGRRGRATRPGPARPPKLALADGSLFARERDESRAGAQGRHVACSDGAPERLQPSQDAIRRIDGDIRRTNLIGATATYAEPAQGCEGASPRVVRFGHAQPGSRRPISRGSPTPRPMRGGGSSRTPPGPDHLAGREASGDHLVREHAGEITLIAATRRPATGPASRRAKAATRPLTVVGTRPRTTSRRSPGMHRPKGAHDAGGSQRAGRR
jgi:hypothetical protein